MAIRAHGWEYCRRMMTRMGGADLKIGGWRHQVLRKYIRDVLPTCRSGRYD